MELRKGGNGEKRERLVEDYVGICIREDGGYRKIGLKRRWRKGRE